MSVIALALELVGLGLVTQEHDPIMNTAVSGTFVRDRASCTL